MEHHEKVNPKTKQCYKLGATTLGSRLISFLVTTEENAASEPAWLPNVLLAFV